ncbi:MAG: type 4a pilus biogenesis protein PilO [Ruminobacter sp.]|jgi:type IV pilus assembly protein PilO|uniref:Pilus assembly protein, PilO n=1 Tax=Ruminobacter amylophilus TaxID=867 RepID=A0A662ZK63_9GAMM|nr:MULTISPECIES: type 4a pilus biogenesis protein PilO [Ruminobacter]MBQ3775742.1 type 4a pilus biogenesis protein PilO [Ruminobacter sp.]SFP58272.1 Pilus assembly protein, PilO [Ruminobacter amylophilus]
MASNLGVGDFDVSRIETWPQVLRYLTGFLLVAAIVGGSFVALNMEQLEEIEKKENIETDLRKQFDEKAKMAVNLEQYKEQIVELESLLDAQLRQLPNSNEVANLLDDISFIAQDNGLNLISIKWESEIVQDIYTELPMSIFVTGTYQQLGSFAADVAALPRIVTIDKFSLKHVDTTKAKAVKASEERPKDGNVTTISTQEAQPAVSDGELLEMNMLAKTFRYNNVVQKKGSDRSSRRNKGGR